MPRMLDMTSDNPHECVHEFHKSEAPVEVVEETNVSAQEVPVSVPSGMVQTGNRPICPHCGCAGKLLGSMTKLGPFQVMVVRCADCHKTLFGFQALELQMVPVPPSVN
jgi:hypothetical protein